MADADYHGVTEEEARKLPCKPEKCAGCAFRPGTLANQWQASSSLIGGQIWLAIHQAVAGKDGFRPFFCHEGITLEEREYFHENGDYADPLPKFRVCAGWLEGIDREKARQASGKEEEQENEEK